VGKGTWGERDEEDAIGCDVIAEFIFAALEGA
jgi:hypothetical protein